MEKGDFVQLRATDGIKVLVNRNPPKFAPGDVGRLISFNTHSHQWTCEFWPYIVSVSEDLIEPFKP